MQQTWGALEPTYGLPEHAPLREFVKSLLDYAQDLAGRDTP